MMVCLTHTNNGSWYEMMIYTHLYVLGYMVKQTAMRLVVACADKTYLVQVSKDKSPVNLSWEMGNLMVWTQSFFR